MKLQYIKTFENYNMSDYTPINEENQYMKITRDKDGNLLLTLAENVDINEINDLRQERGDVFAFEEMFESIKVNSELEYIIDIGEELEEGHLSNSPAIIFRYELKDDGKWEKGVEGELFYQNDYQIRSILECMVEMGSCTLVLNK